MANLREFAARCAATGTGAGASATVARTRQDDDGDRELDSRDHKRSRKGPLASEIVKWSDAQLLNLLVRVPYAYHHEVRAVCRKFNDLVKSDEFRQMRFESKYAEHGCIFAGGLDLRAGPMPVCTLLAWGSRLVMRGFESVRARPIAPLGIPRAGSASLVVENELFIMGGEVDRRGTLTNTVEAYNLRTNEWRSCAPMSEPRGHFAVGVVGGRVVVAGGKGRAGGHLRCLDSAEAYDPATETWTRLPQLPHATRLPAACVLGGCLYLAGGTQGGENQLNHLQMYDGTGWTLKAALPAARSAGCMVAYEGRLVIFGGWIIDEDGELGRAPDILTYDPLTNMWASQPIDAGQFHDRIPTNAIAWESSGKLHLMDDSTFGSLTVFEKETQGGTWVGSQVHLRPDASPGIIERAGARLMLG